MDHLLLVGSLATALLAPVATSPVPVAVAAPVAATINVVAANGSGCPAGTSSESMVAVTSDPADSSAAVLEYSNFLVSAGGDASTSSSYLACTVLLDVQVPSGYTFALPVFENSGYASVLDGAKATVNTRMYYTNSALTFSVSDTITGPYNDDWRMSSRDNISSAGIYRPCGQGVYVGLLTVVALSGTPTTAGAYSSVSLIQQRIDRDTLRLRRC